ncbi:hypothetical protein [Ottowia sp.]|uniref:hypothetical protein n=1 Tax=Ottowia sp. TaxID=1898956 RepID=UPI00260E2748|nr:hypothetical protein [Ottowia sp.]
MNDPHMPALAAKTHPLGVANTRRGTSHVCAWRLDRARFRDPFGHAEFIHTF